MAITTYTNYLTTLDGTARYAGADSIQPHAIDHKDGCPNGKAGWPDTSLQALDSVCEANGCRVGYKVVQWSGYVVDTSEQRRYADSDYYAVVRVAPNKFERVEYATTRGWTYFNNASVDATDEIKSEYAAHVAAHNAEHRAELARIEAAKPHLERLVRVVKGRKIATGTEGEICWIGLDYSRQPRVGLRLISGERVFTAWSNCAYITK